MWRVGREVRRGSAKPCRPVQVRYAPPDFGNYDQLSLIMVLEHSGILACMPRFRSWTDDQLIGAVARSRSYRAVLIELHLIPAGGNYDQIKRRIRELDIDVMHFTGKGWRSGRIFGFEPRHTLEELLTQASEVQSFKLKRRLFQEGVKRPMCEICGWEEKSPDGRIPVELDHINGDRRDNRLENLRILCPNCHSLQPTHRGRNKKVGLARVAE